MSTRAALSIGAAITLLVVATACPRAPATDATALRHATARPPRVVVTVVIDQFAAWIADERLSTLPADGGFARLRREGTYVRDMRYAHAITETGPGHASLYTGVPPMDSGIDLDTHPDPQDGHEISIYLDASTHLLAPDGPRAQPGVSPARLRATTLADLLRARQPAATVVSLSLKDRAALVPAGHAPSACLWFDPHLDTFVTSSAYGDAFPAWARPLADGAALARARRAPWTVLDPAWLRAHASTPDDQKGEADYHQLGRTFPHVAAGPEAPGAFRSTPFADDVLLALADAAVAAAAAAVDVTGAPAGRAPALVEVSLSSNDVIGHTFGPESWEAWDELRRLDLALARFMASLDARLGPDGWALALSADHGVAPLPELEASPALHPWCTGGRPDRWQRSCDPGATRLDQETLASNLQRAAEAAVGPGRWIAGDIEPCVELAPAARALEPERRRALVSALVATTSREPGVARVLDVATLPARCPDIDDESIDALVCRSVVRGGECDLYVVMKPGSIFDPQHERGHGASHGSPYLFDRAVPLLVRAPGRVRAGDVVDGPVPFTTFTLTVGSLLGVTPAVAPSRRALDLTKR